ncbi:uncharacterized protein K444DRAFT_629999 [Hyaloscypha bicolor E]|uniref:DUF7791 domain-containing protein n=1 Tax=Hyaloscypha bicolor E TaxID=1095630 RepID=A0A2J6T9A0_9HELO|nr:uncharacterized protein K444DRAFT_629999 [Hyaloscypha bicolor E]PMD59591.1 hypothetical protein K444DRAFT_629999 [Hyaloscypha bicolor E]
MLQDLTYDDIRNYVSSNFEGIPGFAELQRREPSYAKELQQHVAKKAAGLFQLVRASFKPPTLLTLSFADEELDFVFKSKVQRLTDEERILRADTMRRRLNSRCKGLLEIANTETATAARVLIATPGQNVPAQDADQRTVSVPRKSLADSTVQYLHRTVKDYLELPAVWSRLLEASPNGYNPRLALCGGFIAQLKHIDPNTLNRSTLWNAVKESIKYANVEEDPDGSFANMLDELDRSITTLTNTIASDGHSFLSYYSGYKPREGELYPNWSSTFSGYKPRKENCIQTGVLHFLAIHHREVSTSCL